jgi:hypothetical protein
MFSKFDTNPQSDELTAADLYEAQAAWEADQADHEVEYEWTEEAIEWEEGMRWDNLYDYEELDELYDGEPIMDLPNDLYMIFDDPDYWD